MAKAGDHVRIEGENTYEGILIERPQMLEGDFYVLKLDNGYNIGIDKSKVKKVTVLKDAKPPVVKKKESRIKKGLPTVSIISTGGTISSRVDYRTGGVYADYTAEDFIEMCPELADVANIKAKKVMSIMSEDLDFAAWRKMAKAVKDEIDNGALGVVVTQGTDTLHFSTAALSFIMRGLDRPVIFTAAQRSIDRGSSDAFMNLICAVTAAAKTGIAEVMSCLHGTTNDDYCILIRGTKVRKMHTSRRDAFRPINDLPIAKVFTDGKIEYMQDYRKGTGAKLSLADRFEKKVAMVSIYPGMDPEVIDFYLKKGYKGLVLAATALGHVPTFNKESSILDQLEKAQKKGVAVVVASQTLYGRVHPYVYSNLRQLSIKRGCIFVEDMMPETAYIKLAWVLANHPKDVPAKMLEDVAGELKERTLPDTYLF